jgi:glycerol-3-phosphate dehydrogenase
VFPALAAPEALIAPLGRDRSIAVLPWSGRSIIAGTKGPWFGPVAGSRVDASDVRFLLDLAAREFPGLRFDRRSLLGTFAHARPLDERRGRRPSPLRIDEEASGIFSIHGGAFVTHRIAAARLLDRMFPGSHATTAHRPLFGGELGTWERARPRFHEPCRKHGEEEVRRLYQRYGSAFRGILARIEADPALARPVAPGNPETLAEAHHAIEDESVALPADFLERRTSLRWTAGQGRLAYDAIEDEIRSRGIAPDEVLREARIRYFAELEAEDTLRATDSTNAPPIPSQG